MLRLVSILAIAMAIANTGIPSTWAFVPTSTTYRNQHHHATNNIMASSFLLYFHPEQQQLPPNYNPLNNNFELETQELSRVYDRGAECANNFGMCDVDEVLDLSEGE